MRCLLRFVLALSGLAGLAACGNGAPQSAPDPTGSAVPTAGAGTTAAPSAVASAAPGPSGSPAAAPAAVSNDFGRQLTWKPDASGLAGVRGNHAVVVTLDGKVQAFGPLADVASVFALSPDGGMIAAATQAGAVVLHDARTGKLLAQLQGPAASPLAGEINMLVFSHDGALLAVAGEQLHLYDTATRTQVCEVSTRYFEAAFTPDGKKLAATMNGTHGLYDTKDCRELALGSSETGGTFGSTLSPDGALVVSAAADGHELELQSTQPFRIVKGVLASAKSCEDHVMPGVTDDGKVIYANGSGHWYKSFDAGSRQPIAKWKADDKDVPTGITSFNDGQHIVARFESGKVLIIDARKGATVCEIEGAADSYVWPSPDGKLVASAVGPVVKVWDAATCKLVHTIS
jgi:WD40 repeat protein